MSLKTLWIDPVDACNLDCIMCSFRELHIGENKINLADFLDLLNQAKKIGVKNLNFGTTSEPTLYKDMPLIIDKSKKMGFRINIITNLNFIDPDAELFKAFDSVDNLYVSIDAASKKTYEYIRRLANWSLFVSNLKKLGQSCPGQNIIARFAIQKKNISEIVKFIDFIHGFGFFKEVIFDPVNLKSAQGDYKTVGWSYREALLCKSQLNLARKKAKRYGIKCKQYLTAGSIDKNIGLLSEGKYSNFLDSCFRDLYDSRFPDNNPCNFIESNLFISPKRQVYPCSGAYRVNKLKLGDLSKNSLDEIWNSNLTIRLKKRLGKGLRSDVCRNGCCTFEGQVNEV